MICPNCNTVNENEHVFCINCGANVNQSAGSNVNLGNAPPFDTNQQQQYGTSDSTETVFSGNQNSQSVPNFNPVNPYSGNHPITPKKKNWLFLLGLPLIVLLAIGGGAFYLLTNLQIEKAEVLPEHFGLYFQDSDDSKLTEVKKLDFSNAFEVKDKVLKDENLPELKSKPNLILYSESNDIPLNDLKLIEIDSIQEDGNIKQVEFEAAPVKGKSDMKRIRIKDNKDLATGKYAFALFDGHFDEGKHRFWAFEVKSGTKSDNGDLVTDASISTKPKEVPKATPRPEVPAPVGSSVAVVTQGNVVMRAGPSQSSAKVGKFRAGQKVYVLEYSSNSESFNQYYTNYAKVQTTSGQVGWIYSAFIR